MNHFLRVQKRYIFALIFILICTVAATVAAWNIARGVLMAEKARAFQNETEDIQRWIAERMNIYTVVLQGFQAYWQSSEHVTGNEWESFVKNFHILESYPGVSSATIVEYVTNAQKPAFMKRMQNDPYIKKYLNSAYAIRNENPGNEHYVITYVAPPIGRENAFGLDMATEPMRRETFHRARDTGLVTNTKKITLITTNAPGFILVAPLYKPGMTPTTVEERRAALQGFVFLVFRGSEVFDKIFSKDTDPYPNIDFEIYDGKTADPEGLLYDHNPDIAVTSLNAPSSLRREVQMPFNDQQWTITFAAKPSFSLGGFSEMLPGAVLGTGLVFSLFLALSIAQQTYQHMKVKRQMEEEKS